MGETAKTSKIKKKQYKRIYNISDTDSDADLPVTQKEAVESMSNGSASSDNERNVKKKL